MAELFTSFNIVTFIFFFAYLLIVFWYDQKTTFAWCAVVILLLMGVFTPLEAVLSVNWNVIGIYVGMLFVSEIFIYSRVPDYIAGKIVSRSKKIWVAMLGVCFFSGLLSVVIENVAVVLITAPIALFVAKRLKTNPAPMLIGIALMANLQGVATMIGDPPSLLLASYAKMNFNDFFIFQGKPSLFFAVQVAAIASLLVLYTIFRKYDHPVSKIETKPIRSVFPGCAIAIMVILLACFSMFNYTGESVYLKILSTNKLGLISLFFGFIVWIWYYFREKKDFLPIAKRLDWSTGMFLVAIFMLVEALTRIGFMTKMAALIASHTGGSVLLAYIMIILSSVLLSAFIDNVPFMAAMLPVVGSLAAMMGVSPYLLYFGLVIGASVGGNITPIGASANIVAMGMLKKERYHLKFVDFVKIGLPFTLVSVIASTLFIWLLFK